MNCNISVLILDQVMVTHLSNHSSKIYNTYIIFRVNMYLRFEPFCSQLPTWHMTVMVFPYCREIIIFYHRVGQREATIFFL